MKRRKNLKCKKKPREFRNLNERLPLRVPRFFSISWKVFAGLALLLGLLVTLYNLSARIEVSSSDFPVNPLDPFSSPFKVKNCGIFPIYDVQFSYINQNIQYLNGSDVLNYLEHLNMMINAPLIRRIDAGETTTTFCKTDKFFIPPPNTKTIYADIQVQVRYKPAYLLWSKTRAFRFVTVIENKGTRWVPKALTE